MALAYRMVPGLEGLSKVFAAEGAIMFFRLVKKYCAIQLLNVELVGISCLEVLAI